MKARTPRKGSWRRVARRSNKRALASLRHIPQAACGPEPGETWRYSDMDCDHRDADLAAELYGDGIDLTWGDD